MGTNGQALAHAVAAKLLTRDEGRIASNIAKLPELRRDAGGRRSIGLIEDAQSQWSLIAAAVVGDFEDFVSEIFRLTLARESIQLAKFLIVGGAHPRRRSAAEPDVLASRVPRIVLDEGASAHLAARLLRVERTSAACRFDNRRG